MPRTFVEQIKEDERKNSSHNTKLNSPDGGYTALWRHAFIAQNLKIAYI